MYRIFTRTWWKYNPSYPGGREPSPGRKTTIAKARTEEEAQLICRRWNNEHNPGKLSRKAEYQEIT